MRWFIAFIYLISLSFLQNADAQEANGKHAFVDTLPEAVKIGHRSGAGRVGTYINDIQVFRSFSRSPVGENDPVNFVLSLPGVSGGMEGFSAYYVRGGDVGGNTICLEGVPIYGHSHLLGMTTIVPQEAISSVAFSVGGFTGRELNQTASRLSLSTRAANRQNADYQLSVSNSFVSGSLSVPVSKDVFSMSATGRYATLGGEYAVAKRLFDANNTWPGVRPIVFDVLSKAEYRISGHDSLSLVLFGSQDTYHLNVSPTDRMLLNWQNEVAVLNFGSSSRNWNFEAHLSYNHFISRQQHQTMMENAMTDLKLQSRLEEITFFTEVTHSITNSSRLCLGLHSKKAFFSPGSAKYSDAHQAYSEKTGFVESKSSPWLTAAYLQYNYLTDSFDGMAMFRGSLYVNRIPGDESICLFRPEFSLSARYSVNTCFGFEATFDNVVQFYHTLEGLPIGWPLDLIVPSTKMLLPERMRQYSFGFFSKWSGWNVSLAGYYKKMWNLTYYTNAAAVFSAAATGWEDNVDIGEGRSCGLELRLAGKIGRIEANLSYTLSKTNRTFSLLNSGRPFPAKYDRPHILNTDASYLLKANTYIQQIISASFVLQSGHRESVRSGVYRGYYPGGDVLLDFFGGPNNYQMPLYVRLDMGYTVKWGQKYKHEITAGVFNVLNRHNPSIVSYDMSKGCWVAVSLFPLMPNLRYSWHF